MTPRIQICPGAILHVNIDEFRAFERAGLKWSTPAKEIDREPTRRSEARLECANECASREGVAGRVYFGLCGSCAGYERREREARRKVDAR